MNQFLVIAFEFPPIRASNDRTYHFCRYLPNYSWKPIVVAPQKPNFFLNYDKSYTKPQELEVHHASAKLNLGTIAAYHFFKTLPDHSGFMKSSYRVASNVLKEKARELKFIYASVPLPSSLFSAARLSQEYNLPLVFDFRDPFYPSDKYKKEFHEITKYPKLIITPTEKYKDVLVKQGFDRSIIEIIPNGTDLQTINEMKKESISKSKTFTVIYAGGYFKIYRIRALVEAARQLQNEDISFVVVGRPDEGEGIRLKQEVKNLNNIKFLGRLPQKDTIRELMKASIAYNGSMHPGGLGGKVFDYMACGLPIVGFNPLGSSTHNFIESNNVGLVSEKEEDLIKNILRFKNEPDFTSSIRKNCQAVVQNYDRKTLSKKLADIFNEYFLK